MSNRIFNLSSILNGRGGVTLTSSASGFGDNVASAGDFNCDGKNGDVIVCANGGPCYLFFSGYFNDIAEADTLILNGTNGCTLIGPTNSEFGGAIALASNITGNGCSGIMIAAYGISIVYTLFPMRYPPAVYNISNVNASTGLIFVGIPNTALGAALAGDGDVDGDGKTDIALTTSANTPTPSYVVLGRSNFTALAQLGQVNVSAPPAGAYIINIVGPLGLGIGICIAADLNKDGFDDIAISMNGDVNAVALLFGAASLPSLINVSTPNGTNVSLLTSSSSYFGGIIVPAGHVNSNGYEGLLIGSFAETASVLFGQPFFPATFDTSSFNGTNGVNLTSSIGGSFGFSVTKVGYTNSNGLNGFLVGTVSSNSTFFFNGRETWPATVDTSSLNCLTGIELLSSISQAGCVLANIGDFNGDGIPDFVMGSCGTQNVAAIVFGQSFVTCTATPTSSQSDSRSQSAPTRKNTRTPTTSLSYTASKSAFITESPTDTRTLTQSRSHLITSTPTATLTSSRTKSESQILTITQSSSHAMSESGTQSPSSNFQTHSPTKSSTLTASSVLSSSFSATKSATEIDTASQTESSRHSLSITWSATSAETKSASVSFSPTASVSSLSSSHSLSFTTSQSRTASGTSSTSGRWSSTEAESSTQTHTATPTRSSSSVVSLSFSTTKSVTEIATASHTEISSDSLSITWSATTTPRGTASASASLSLGHSETASSSQAETLTSTQAQTKSASVSQATSASFSGLRSYTKTDRGSHSESQTEAHSASVTPTATPSVFQAISKSLTTHTHSFQSSSITLTGQARTKQTPTPTLTATRKSTRMSTLTPIFNNINIPALLANISVQPSTGGSTSVLFNHLDNLTSGGCELPPSIIATPIGNMNCGTTNDVLIQETQPSGAVNLYVVFASSNACFNLNMSQLDGTDGFQIVGVPMPAGTHLSFANTGNLTGCDGLMIGDTGALNGLGQVYIIDGSKSFPSVVNVSDVLTLNGTSASPGLGASLQSIDMGDGQHSMVVATLGSTFSAPESFIVGLPQQLYGDLSLNAGSTVGIIGFSSLSGWTLQNSPQVINIGDFNHDGMQDVAYSIYNASPNGMKNAGIVIVVFGGLHEGSTLNISTVNGTNGFIINGIAPGDLFGWAVVGVGDFNGDKIDDFMVGAYAASPTSALPKAGRAFMFYGTKAIMPAVVYIASYLESGKAGFIFDGLNSGDNTGYALASLGYVTNDTYTAVAISAPGASAITNNRRSVVKRSETILSGAGAIYILCGRPAMPPEFNSDSSDGGICNIAFGTRPNQGLGFSLSSAGNSSIVIGNGNGISYYLYEQGSGSSIPASTSGTLSIKILEILAGVVGGISALIMIGAIFKAYRNNSRFKSVRYLAPLKSSNAALDTCSMLAESYETPAIESLAEKISAELQRSEAIASLDALTPPQLQPELTQQLPAVSDVNLEGQRRHLPTVEEELMSPAFETVRSIDHGKILPAASSSFDEKLAGVQAKAFLPPSAEVSSHVEVTHTEIVIGSILPPPMYRHHAPHLPPQAVTISHSSSTSQHAEEGFVSESQPVCASAAVEMVAPELTPSLDPISQTRLKKYADGSRFKLDEIPRIELDSLSGTSADSAIDSESSSSSEMEMEDYIVHTSPVHLSLKDKKDHKRHKKKREDHSAEKQQPVSQDLPSKPALAEETKERRGNRRINVDFDDILTPAEVDDALKDSPAVEAPEGGLVRRRVRRISIEFDHIVSSGDSLFKRAAQRSAQKSCAGADESSRLGQSEERDDASSSRYGTTDQDIAGVSSWKKRPNPRMKLAPLSGTSLPPVAPLPPSSPRAAAVLRMAFSSPSNPAAFLMEGNGRHTEPPELFPLSPTRPPTSSHVLLSDSTLEFFQAPSKISSSAALPPCAPMPPEASDLPLGFRRVSKQTKPKSLSARALRQTSSVVVKAQPLHPRDTDSARGSGASSLLSGEPYHEYSASYLNTVMQTLRRPQVMVLPAIRIPTNICVRGYLKYVVAKQTSSMILWPLIINDDTHWAGIFVIKGEQYRYIDTENNFPPSALGPVTRQLVPHQTFSNNCGPSLVRFFRYLITGRWLSDADSVRVDRDAAGFIPYSPAQQNAVVLFDEADQDYTGFDTSMSEASSSVVDALYKTTGTWRILDTTISLVEVYQVPNLHRVSSLAISTTHLYAFFSGTSRSSVAASCFMVGYTYYTQGLEAALVEGVIALGMLGTPAVLAIFSPTLAVVWGASMLTISIAHVSAKTWNFYCNLDKFYCDLESLDTYEGHYKWLYKHTEINFFAEKAIEMEIKTLHCLGLTAHDFDTEAG